MSMDMEEGRNISELPEDIIQHIQSFMDIKQGTQSTLLSKSWLRAWSTRPFLDFDSKHLNLKDNNRLTFVERAGSVINSTLARYVEQGITIVKLRLDLVTIEERWLQLACQNNVIELDICPLYPWQSTEHWLEIFLTKSLQVLRVKNCSYSNYLFLSDTDIECRNLKKLELYWVHIDYVTFQHIMCSCPLIEELLLDYCKLVNLSNSWEFEGEFASLKRLTLSTIKIKEGLQILLSNSPKLEDLTLFHCFSSVKPIELSSLSLKRAKIDSYGWEEIIIDAPNLRRLNYVVDWKRNTIFPTIRSPATEGEIDVDIRYTYKEIDASWFHGLTEFLSKFAKSNLKFTTNYRAYDSIDAYPLVVNVQPVNIQPFSLLQSRHQVKSLTFNLLFPCRELLDAFFTICRPKTLLFKGRNKAYNLDFLRGLCKNSGYPWYKGNLLECCKLDQDICRRHNIKDAKFYHVVDNQQKPLHMHEMDELSKIRGYRWVTMDISLALEWECSD